jgi:EmrB/QacA subfamily drug resistance transporter
MKSDAERSTGWQPSDVPALVLSPRRRRAVTAGIMTGMFLAALEATVIATAMPTVIASVGGMHHYSWVFSAYLLSSTVTVPLWGKLSDLYGRRLLYQIAIAVFLAGSVASGFAATMNQLIAFRALQGLGAGGLIPLGMTIVGEIFTLRERAKMQGLFSGVWGIASIVGPLVGGFLTDQVSWRWVFFINVPFGIAAAAIIGVALAEPPRRRRPQIDYAGAITLSGGVTILLLALVGGEESGATLRTTLFGVSLLLLAAFLFVERRAAEPIVPLGLFRNRVVAVAITTGFLAGIAMFGAITFVPLFAQGARGSTATEAGSLLTPLMLAWVTMSIVGGRLLLRISFRPMVLTGFSFLTAGFAIFATFDRSTPHAWLAADLALIGSGLGLTMLTLLLAVQHSVPRAQLGISTSLNQFFRSIGGAVGVAVMGALLTAGLGSSLLAAAGDPSSGITPQMARSLASDPAALIEGGEPLAPAALETLRNALASSLRQVFVLGAAISFLALLIAFFWMPKMHEGAREETDPESGERMVMAELTTLEPQDEPVGVNRPE